MIDDKNIAAWKRHLEHVAGFSKNTVEAYSRDVEQFDGVPTRDGIEDFLARLAEKGIAASSRSRKLASLRSYFRFCVERGLTQSDPTRNVTAPKASRTLPKPMPAGAIAAMLDACPPTSFRRTRLRAIVDLSWSCGLRISEALQIRLGDLQGDSLTIRGKGGKERLLPVAAGALESIDAYRRFRPEGGEVLFVTGDGEALDRHAVASSMRALAKRAGVGHVSPHRLRHSAASGLIEGGADLMVVMTMLGHASVGTTQRYLLVADERLRNVVLSCHPRGKNVRTVRE